MTNPEAGRAHLEELIRQAATNDHQTTGHAEYLEAARNEFAEAGFAPQEVPARAIAIRAHELLASEEDEIIDELDEEGRLGA
jgi:hypothetical protein